MIQCRILGIRAIVLGRYDYFTVRGDEADRTRPTFLALYRVLLGVGGRLEGKHGVGPWAGHLVNPFNT